MSFDGPIRETGEIAKTMTTDEIQCLNQHFDVECPLL